MQVNQQHINKSLKIYLYSPFIKTEEYNKNMMILEKMGHKITNEYYLNKTKILCYFLNHKFSNLQAFLPMDLLHNLQ